MAGGGQAREERKKKTPFSFCFHFSISAILDPILPNHLDFFFCFHLVVFAFISFICLTEVKSLGEKSKTSWNY